MTRPAASYARLSRTANDSEPNTDRQHRQNIAYLERLGYSVADTARYTEPVGMRSGRKLSKRPQMRALLRDLSKYKALAFFNFSRFSRSTEFAFEFIRAANKLGVAVYDTTAQRRISIDSASDFLATVTTAGYSEYEALVGMERMSSYYKDARRLGWVVNRRAPLGLLVTGSKADRHFEKAKDFGVVLQIVKLLARGHTPFEIANELSRDRVMARTPSGKPTPIQEFHVRGVVRRLAVYREFIPAPILAAAMRRVKERAIMPGRAKPIKYPVLLLSHILTCADCGRPFRTTWDRSRTTGKPLPTYRHQEGYVCPNRRKVTARKIDVQAWAVLDKLVLKLARRDLARSVIAATQETPARDLAAERTELERQLRTAKEHLLHERIAPADFDEFAKEVNEKLLKLGKEETPNAPLSIEDVRLIAESARGWRMMAEKNPREFNLMLRDIFKRVAIKRDNTLIIELAPPFKSLR